MPQYCQDSGAHEVFWFWFGFWSVSSGTAFLLCVRFHDVDGVYRFALVMFASETCEFFVCLAEICPADIWAHVLTDGLLLNLPTTGEIWLAISSD